MGLSVGGCVFAEIVAALDDDGAVGLGFETVVDECIGEVNSVLPDEDASAYVAFNFGIVVPYDGLLVSMISATVVCSAESVNCVKSSSVVTKNSSSKTVGTAAVVVVVVVDVLVVAGDVLAIDATLFGAVEDAA